MAGNNWPNFLIEHLLKSEGLAKNREAFVNPTGGLKLLELEVRAVGAAVV